MKSNNSLSFGNLWTKTHEIKRIAGTVIAAFSRCGVAPGRCAKCPLFRWNPVILWSYSLCEARLHRIVLTWWDLRPSQHSEILHMQARGITERWRKNLQTWWTPLWCVTKLLRSPFAWSCQYGHSPSSKWEQKDSPWTQKATETHV